jgi:hypothetical protein
VVIGVDAGGGDDLVAGGLQRGGEAGPVRVGPGRVSIAVTIARRSS